MPQIQVKLPTCSYTITIEAGSMSRVGEVVRGVAPHERAFLAIDRNIMTSHGGAALHSLRKAGYHVHTAPVVADETNKTPDGVRELYGEMALAKLERLSPVVALGGGIVGDMAGFAAATYLRGVPLIQVPTTLLAMVDASIGGKTGANLYVPGGTLAKNLIGAFWQPRAVVIDPEALRTLSERDFRCGLAECVKHALIADEDYFQFICHHTEQIAAVDMNIVTELICRSAMIKAAIVQEDEREAGRRALLNLGHTFAHAIEPIEQLHLRHGEAVAIGLMAAAKCAVDTGRLAACEAKRIGSLLLKLHLPVWLPKAVEGEQLLAAMQYDKKIANGRLRLVLPVGVGRAEIVDDVPEEVVKASLHEIGAMF